MKVKKRRRRSKRSWWRRPLYALAWIALLGVIALGIEFVIWSEIELWIRGALGLVGLVAIGIATHWLFQRSRRVFRS